MNSNNPYHAPTQDDPHFESVDPQMVRYIAEQLAKARREPPTLWSVLNQWPGTPVRVLLGVFGTLGLLWLTQRPGSLITREWPVGFGAMIFGAVLRDVALARRVVRFWRPQSQLIDWQKVDELTG